MYKYKLFFSEKENDAKEILKKIKTTVPSWECASITNISDPDYENYDTQILITNNMSYDSLDQKASDANVEVMTALFNLLDVRNFVILTDTSYNIF